MAGSIVGNVLALLPVRENEWVLARVQPVSKESSKAKQKQRSDVLCPLARMSASVWWMAF
jgi:hypothetical protein